MSITNELGGVTSPSDFKNEHPYDVHFDFDIHF